MEQNFCEKKFIKSFKYKHKINYVKRKKRFRQKERQQHRNLPFIDESFISSFKTNDCDHQFVKLKLLINNSEDESNEKIRLKLRTFKRQNFKSIIVYLFAILVALHQVPARLTFCPSKCICNDQSLSANCTQVPSLSVIPITLNPLLKQLTLNQLPIVELANSLSVYRQLEYLNLASNQIRQINYENFNFKPAPHSVNLMAATHHHHHHQNNNDDNIVSIINKNQQHEWNSKQENMARFLKLSIDKSISGTLSGNQEDEIGFHLRELDLQDNKIEQLGSFMINDKFDNFENVDLDLSQKQLQASEMSHTSDNKRHNSLLKGADLERQAPFLMLTKLESLNLSRNKLVQLNQHVFLGLMHLKQLDLSHNQLEFIHQNSLVGLIALQVLNLNHNRLATHLNRLKLAFCGAPLNEIRHLDLSDNERAISSIEHSQRSASIVDVLLPNQMFICSPKILTLSLNGLQLRHIQVNAFDNVLHLEALNLSRNFLEHVPSDSLSNPNSNLTFSLKQLDLSDTLIEFVNAGSFESLRNLQKLSMNSMRHLVSFDLAALSAWSDAENKKSLRDGFETSIKPEDIDQDKRGSENIEQLMRSDGDFRKAIKTLLPEHLFQRTVGESMASNLEQTRQQQQQQPYDARKPMKTLYPHPHHLLINDQLIELQLRNCKRLQSMHSSLASKVSFTKLRLIDLNGANELRELPLDKMINLSQSTTALLDSKLNVDLSFAGQLNCSSCQMGWLVEAAKFEQRRQLLVGQNKQPLMVAQSPTNGLGWFQMQKLNGQPETTTTSSELHLSGERLVTLIGSDLIGCSWPIAMPLAHLAASLLADNSRQQLAVHLCVGGGAGTIGGSADSGAHLAPISFASDEFGGQIRASGVRQQFGGDDTSPLFGSTTDNPSNNKSSSAGEPPQTTDLVEPLLVALLAALVLIGLIGRPLAALISSYGARGMRQQFKWSRSTSISLAASSQLNSPATSSSGQNNTTATSANNSNSNNNNDCSSSSIMSSLAANGPMSSSSARQWPLSGHRAPKRTQPRQDPISNPALDPDLDLVDPESPYESVPAASGRDRLYCNGNGNGNGGGGRLIAVDELIFSGLPKCAQNGQIEPCSNKPEQADSQRPAAGNLFSRIKAQFSGSGSGSSSSRSLEPSSKAAGLRAWLAILRKPRQLASLGSSYPVASYPVASYPAASYPAPVAAGPALHERHQQWLSANLQRHRKHPQQLPMLPVLEREPHPGCASQSWLASSVKIRALASELGPVGGPRQQAVNHSQAGPQQQQQQQQQLMKEEEEEAQNFKLYENCAEHLYNVVPQQAWLGTARLQVLQEASQHWQKIQPEHQLQLIMEPNQSRITASVAGKRAPVKQASQTRLIEEEDSSAGACAQNFARSAEQVNNGPDRAHLNLERAQMSAWRQPDPASQPLYRSSADDSIKGSSLVQTKLAQIEPNPASPYLCEQRSKPQYNGHLDGQPRLAAAAGCPGGGYSVSTAAAAAAADRHIYVTLDRPIKKQNVAPASSHYEPNDTTSTASPNRAPQTEQLQLERASWTRSEAAKGGFSDNLGRSILPDDYKSFEWSNSKAGQQQQQQQQHQQQRSLNEPLEISSTKFKALEQQTRSKSSRPKTTLVAATCSDKEAQIEGQSVKLSSSFELELIEGELLENNERLQNGPHQAGKRLHLSMEASKQQLAAEAANHFRNKQRCCIYDSNGGSDFAVKNRKLAHAESSHNGNVTGHSDYDDDDDDHHHHHHHDGGGCRSRSRSEALDQGSLLKRAANGRQRQLALAGELNGNPVSGRLDERRRINEIAGLATATDVKLNGAFKQPTIQPSLTDDSGSFGFDSGGQPNGKYDANHDASVVVVVASGRNMFRNLAAAGRHETVVSAASNCSNSANQTTNGASSRRQAPVKPSLTTNNNNNNGSQTSYNDDQFAELDQAAMHYDDYVINGSSEWLANKANHEQRALNQPTRLLPMRPPVVDGSKTFAELASEGQLSEMGVPIVVGSDNISELNRSERSSSDDDDEFVSSNHQTGVDVESPALNNSMVIGGKQRLRMNGNVCKLENGDNHNDKNNNAVALNSSALSDEQLVWLRTKQTSANQAKQITEQVNAGSRLEFERCATNQPLAHEGAPAPNIINRQTVCGDTFKRTKPPPPPPLQTANEIYSNQFYYCKPRIAEENPPN